MDSLARRRTTNQKAAHRPQPINGPGTVTTDCISQQRWAARTAWHKHSMNIPRWQLFVTQMMHDWMKIHCYQLTGLPGSTTNYTGFYIALPLNLQLSTPLNRKTRVTAPATFPQIWMKIPLFGISFLHLRADFPRKKEISLDVVSMNKTHPARNHPGDEFDDV